MTVKEVKVVLNAGGTAVDSDLSTVKDATVFGMAKQCIPLVKDNDVAIIGDSATRTVVELGVTAGVLYAGEKLQPVGKLIDAVRG